MTQQLSLTRPDDWHIHLREGAYLANTVKDASSQFTKVLVMPNLVIPISNVTQALVYRDQILSHSISHNFKPYMTLYLTSKTTCQDVKDGAASAYIKGIKWYPKHGTTNSNAAIDNIMQCDDVLNTMQEYQLPLLIHGELAQYPVYEREKRFIDQIMLPLVTKFPHLKIVIEHISTKESVEFVSSAAENIAATITPQHLLYTINNLIGSTIDPHYFCMPILKSPIDCATIRKAAISGNSKFFAGTDSAPHPKKNKESTKIAAGCYTAYHATQLYCEIFDELNALDKLNNFISKFGATFYNEPMNSDTIKLIKKTWQIPTELPLGDEIVVPLGAGKNLQWQIVDPKVALL